MTVVTERLDGSRVSVEAVLFKFVVYRVARGASGVCSSATTSMGGRNSSSRALRETCCLEIRRRALDTLFECCAAYRSSEMYRRFPGEAMVVVNGGCWSPRVYIYNGSVGLRKKET